MKRDISTKDEKKGISRKARLAIICSAAVLAIAVITVSAGFALYFNSPVCAAVKLVDAIKNEDGEWYVSVLDMLGFL